jgi:hypothetical protein
MGVEKRDGGVAIVAVERKENNWVFGSCGRYKFEAKVYGTGSQYGINGGRVSKISVWHTQNGKKTEILSYDRGWDKKPQTDEHRELVQALIAHPEQIPVS